MNLADEVLFTFMAEATLLQAPSCFTAQSAALIVNAFVRAQVRCSALQCVAVRCSALQCVAVRCCSRQLSLSMPLSALKSLAVCCSMLQCVAVCCSVS